MPASQHTIAGTVVTMPVKIRKANQYTGMFSVDADTAQQMIDYSGLEVCRYLPGRAIVILMLMRYIDGDLGQYLEYGTNVMVNPPGSNATGPRAMKSAAPSSITSRSTRRSLWKRDKRFGATPR